MELIHIDTEMERINHDKFLQTAEELTRVLRETVVAPVQIATIGSNGQVRQTTPVSKLPDLPLGKNDKVVLDFGDHYVGYVTLKICSVGSPPDSPAYLRLKFGEIAKEITESSADYNGWISESWIQEEFIHIDVLPCTLTLPRRYAFRFLEIQALGAYAKYKIIIEDASCRAVSAVDCKDASPLDSSDPLEQKLDAISLRTLQNCMQSVYEDGPKRDRRLWLGDLRLEALTNYATFRDFDLVRRCLYLFAGQTRGDGAIGACLFTEPQLIVDDTFLFDYSLFFVATLRDYYEASGDIDTVKELWEPAYRQIELSRAQMDEEHIVIDQDGFWCFVDWTEGLNKQASAQAIYIYALNAAITLAGALGYHDIAGSLELEKQESIRAAKTYLWDAEQQVFVSGAKRQVSYASQVWMVLAGVVGKQDGAALLNRIDDIKPPFGMVTPYMNHHYVEALILCKETKKANEHLRRYWGGMAAEGADTFWELYNPDDSDESPYGSSIVNSYCHAWSCTPAYILRVLLKKS